MTVLPAIDPGRVIADLRELDRRTGGPHGAQRLCWGDGWREARSLLADLLGEIGLTAKADAAGNLWASLQGDGSPPWRWARTSTRYRTVAGWTALWG